MPNRRTPQPGPRRHSRQTSRPGGRGTERSRPVAAPMVRPRFTGRMAILVLVAAVLVVSYASSMRAYLQQRGQVSDLRAQIASSQTDILALEREKRRWKDPEYVRQQARARFGWVLPGETAYQVIGKDGKPLERSDALTDPSSVAKPVPESWWGKVYGTLEAADHPKKKPTPATKIQP
jgi:cell division protein FtsB